MMNDECLYKANGCTGPANRIPFEMYTTKEGEDYLKCKNCDYPAGSKFPKGIYVYSSRMPKARQIPKGFYVKICLQT